ncbi:DMSO/selenate family reductase complex A subunit [Telmatospirillum sp.]|uniref:DMSO/selenate family reductase complex A subunit n=1 Tax=Telmatospirillum sp. TaxID=2079197 RepID=UPI0028501164|nr:DMSO/selenate family reductase complex A subunit [Telmatospirillum sp.]MDR3439064.1 molybdopterin-dependent oxidoreductase [Telmatospirillum sp.]
MREDFSELLLKRMTRRDVMGGVIRTGVAASVCSGLALPFKANSKEDVAASPLAPGAAEPGEVVRHSACLVNCGSRCALKVVVKDDRIVRIEPEPAGDEAVFGQHQIRPCLRGRSSRWRVYSPDRLKYPLKRVGPRGEGKFARISWDEATSMVASEIKRVREKYGNAAIYYNYGSGAYYSNQGSHAWKRLLGLAGGFLQYHNTYSTAEIATITPYSQGTYVASPFQEVRHSDLVVLFGLNLSETRMSGGGQVEEMRRALEISNPRVIIIDPRRTDSVVAEHAEWLPIHPTTDAALVAALAHTLITEGLIDEAMVNRYCVGYDAGTLPAGAPANAGYKDYILGSGDDHTEKTPEWAAPITGIPAVRIRQLAREIASARNCYIAQGWGPQRHAVGEQSAWAIQILPMLTGQFGRPGTNNGNWPYATPYGVPTLPDGTNPVALSIPCYLWTDAVAHPEEITAKTAYLKGGDKLDVGIKLIINHASNTLLNQHGEINRTRKILEDTSLCETIVVIDNHMTPSARFADILLPETSYLEAEDLVDNSYASGAYNFMIAMQKTIQPMWEVRSTYDVCADIAGVLGVRDRFTEGRTQAQWVEAQYQQVCKKRPYLPDWSQARNMGVIDRQAAPDGTGIAFADFRRDPAAAPLKTGSGKVELYSAALARLAKEWVLLPGQVIPPIPAFVPATESHLNKDLATTYPLQLCDFHTKGHTHSTYANLPQLHEAVPDQLWINPIDARSRHLSTGDRVRVFNDRGALEISCKVTDRIIPGVTAMPQGCWTRLDARGIDVGGCINTLTSHIPTPLAKGNPQHTNMVEVMRAEEVAL